MTVVQFEDKNLAHYSYGIVSDGEIVVIDPSRDPGPYYDFAKENNGRITAIIETHPHADFISGHLEMHRATGAPVYVSKLLGAAYPHQPFDEGQFIQAGGIRLKAINTPGHSPDSITIILEDADEKDLAVFTGDTLLIGDCGRPDLREHTGNIQQKQQEQARQMYRSLKKYLPLQDEIWVYPAHGAGSLCGKTLSDENRSTIGNEKLTNWSLQAMPEDAFVSSLLEDLPFIPKYFAYNVEMNRRGAPGFRESVDKVKIIEPVTGKEAADLLSSITIVDTRPQQQYKKAYLDRSINIQDDRPFETWLGSIIAPNEKFYLAAGNEAQLLSLIRRAAKIGYEPFIESAFVLDFGDRSMPEINLQKFKNKPDNYTIIDVRSKEEAREKIFNNSINIPLYQLRERIQEIPAHKLIAVHCSSGYRSAAGSSILKNGFGDHTAVFDLGDAVKEFKP